MSVEGEMRKPWQPWFCGQGLWLLAFGILWLALRVFWLTGDAGVPSLWEYGFNVTDEGYYLGAGKDKFLYGAFCDFTRNESFTFGYSPLTHWLSFASYRVFGLSDWAWRIPFCSIYFIAWLMVFRYVQKRCGSVCAFVGCTLISAMPVVVAYERQAVCDVLIASLTAIAFCVASGKGVWRIFVSALALGLVSLVKPSVWILLPVVAAGILSRRKTRFAWLDLLLFVLAVFASVGLWKALELVSLLPETARHGMSASEVVRRTTTHNALPSLLDFGPLLRGLASFPRGVCFKAFSGVGILMSAVPFSLAAHDAFRRKWNWRILLYIAYGAYIAAVSVMNTTGLRYYHSSLMLLPLVLCATWEDLRQDGGQPASARPALLWGALLGVVVAGSVVAYLAVDATILPKDAIRFFSNESNLPQDLVWKLNGGYAALAGVLALASIGFVRGLRATLREGFAWFACAFFSASVALSTIAIPSVAYYVRLKAEDFVLPMALTFVLGVGWTVIVFGWSGELRRRAFLCFVPAVVILSFACTPSWRRAVTELARPPAHVHRQVAAEIAELAPTNSVVLGERSSRVLMGLPYRTATTMPACNPIPILNALFKANQDEHVYALLDSQNAYNLQHLQKHRDEYTLAFLKKFSMPSFADARPADVYFCKVLPVRSAVRAPIPNATFGSREELK